MNLILQHFSAPGLIWQAAFKKTKIKLDLLIDIDILLEEEYVTLFFDMQKLIANKNKKLYLYWHKNKLCSWVISKVF